MYSQINDLYRPKLHNRHKIKSGFQWYISIQENKERSLIGIKKPTNQYQYIPHFTLHNIVFAVEFIEYLGQNKFDHFIKNINKIVPMLYNKFFMDETMTFKCYSVLGKKTKMLVAEYEMSDISKINNFRNELYNIIIWMSGGNLAYFSNMEIDQHKLMFIDGIPALYVPTYSFGVDVFTPHMTLGSMRDFETQNLKKFRNIIKKKTINGKNYYSIKRNADLSYLDKFRPEKINLGDLKGRHLSLH